MLKVADDYTNRMGIVNTQFIIARHFDKEHPHIHIVFNRIDNQGKTISNKNDCYRSEKICKEITRKYGLYFAKGKENVNVHRLKEPDKIKYEIYNCLKELIPKCKDMDELEAKRNKEGITVHYKYRGDTNVVQGISFTKNDLKFNGSKIDRTKEGVISTNKACKEKEQGVQDVDHKVFPNLQKIDFNSGKGQKLTT